MEWSDKGIVLSSRKHGENAAIVSLLTQTHGRHSGLVRGGSSSRARAIYQTGNLVKADWRARLEEHLGTFSCELVRSNAAKMMDERLPLQALIAATSMIERLLPERESYPETFKSLCSLITRLTDQDHWLPEYIYWEIGFLADLGYGLDFTRCAATGETENLVFVSPRSGGAVSQKAGEPYKDKLFPLPAFLLRSDTAPGVSQILDGLRITSHFLALCARDTGADNLPPARGEFIKLLARS